MPQLRGNEPILGPNKKMRHYKSTKELWLQLENCYQNETQEEEKSCQSEQQDLDTEDSY
jgi:hypothetical protein